MKKPPRSLRPFATVAAGLLALVACQNATDSNSTNSGPMKAIATLPFSDTVRVPDSTAWSTATDSGHGGLSCSGTTCHDTLSLKDPLGSQVAYLQLWTLGIHLETLRFTQSGSNPNLIAPDTFHIDSLGLKLLESFDSLRQSKAKSDSLAKAGPLASDLIAYYASLLLSGDITFKGFPSAIPAGLDPSVVRHTLVLLGLQAGKTPVQIASLGLGLDTGSIRTIAGILVQANLLKTTDTLVWFHPVRVSGAASVAGSLTAGGSAVNVNGSFSWNAGAEVTLSHLSVRSPNPGDSSNFWFPTKQFNPSKIDTVWNLSGNLTVQALASAPVGWDTLVVTLSTDSAHAATLRVPFQVVTKDVTPPALILLSPTTDTATVPNATSTFVVKALATDSGSGVDSLKIGTKTFRTAAKIADTLWDTLSLVVGANLVSVQAWDHAGNTSTAIITITHAPFARDSTPPKIVRGGPTKDTAVSWGTQMISLSWAITSDTTLSQVTLNGSPLTSSTSSFQTTVSLKVGIDTFRLLAVDGRGNLSWDSLHIVRQADLTPPSLKITSPSKDTTLPNSTSFVVVSASASDSISGLASVQIGTRPPRTSAPFSDTIYLAAGVDTIVVQALDNAGNRTADTIHVTRTPPTVVIAPPKVQRVSPSADTTVGWDTKAIALSWTVTDDSAFTVTVNSTPLTSKSALFQTTPQSLVTGTNMFILQAFDAHGTSTSDTIRVMRQSTNPPPVVARSSPSQDTVILKSQSSLSASWKVTDPSLQSVSINGIAATLTGGVYSSSVSFSGDSRDSLWVTLVATDSSTTTTRDSIKVWRLDLPTLTSGNQAMNGTLALTITSNLGGAHIGYSTDRVHWFSYPNGGLSVSQNEILYAQDTLGSAISAIDSSVFLYIPSPALTGITSTQATVTITPTGSAGIEDSLSTGSTWTPYTTPFTITGNTKVFARSRLGAFATAKQEIDFAVAPILVASPKDTGVSALNVTITSPSADAIQVSTDQQATWQTLSGSTYPMSTGTLYARTKLGSAISPTSSVAVQLYLGPPTFSTPAGSYPVPQAVTINSAPGGAIIYYTTDGSAPSLTHGTQYVGPVAVSVNQTLKAVAIKAGFSNSTVGSAAYAIADTTGGYNPNVVYHLVADSSGNLYRTVNIGSQNWMAQDLINPVDGTKTLTWSQAMGLPDSCGNSLACTFDSTNTQGACPANWRVPLASEFASLIQLANGGNGSDSTAMVHLASSGVSWSYTGRNTVVGDNSTGFSVSPQGQGGGGGQGGTYGMWWSADQLFNRLYAQVLTGHAGIAVGIAGKNGSYALRCISN